MNLQSASRPLKLTVVLSMSQTMSDGVTLYYDPSYIDRRVLVDDLLIYKIILLLLMDFVMTCAYRNATKV